MVTRKRHGRHVMPPMAASPPSPASPTPDRNPVTGGAGFLGSHLVERHLNMGHDVLCVDNFDTGSKANIRQLLDHPRFELLRRDALLRLPPPALSEPPRNVAQFRSDPVALAK
jgi:hypothetical protein